MLTPILAHFRSTDETEVRVAIPTRDNALIKSSFEGVGGLNIFTRSWHPTDGKPRAVVVIVSGFNSHSGHYLWVADQFVNHGLAVYALDLRGRGKSDGERFYVAKFEDYVNDVATFVTLAKSQDPGLPVFLLGHSAGVSFPAFIRLSIRPISTVWSARALHTRCRRPISPSPCSKVCLVNVLGVVSRLKVESYPWPCW